MRRKYAECKAVVGQTGTAMIDRVIQFVTALDIRRFRQVRLLAIRWAWK